MKHLALHVMLVSRPRGLSTLLSEEAKFDIDLENGPSVVPSVENHSGFLTIILDMNPL